jgi:hypothetical protein
MQKTDWSHVIHVCGRYGLSWYNSEDKDYAKLVFTYAGPRMMLQNPILILDHLIDDFRK